MRRKIRGQLRAPKEISFQEHDKFRQVRVVEEDLTQGDADEYAFAWQNPHDKAIQILSFMTKITTAGGTGSSVLYVGSGATDTTEATGITDDIDLNATGYSTRLGAVMDKKGDTLDYLTGRIKDENAASLVGTWTITYVELD